MNTNGLDIERIIEVFGERIGWQQDTIQQYAIVSDENQASSTGRYFNDGSFHPLVTIKNIKETVENSELTGEPFNEKLWQIQKSAIIQSLNTVFNKPQLIDNSLLFDRSENNDNEITNSGKFVGIRFKVAAGYSLQIDSISALFSKAQPLNLLLFHESKRLPLATIPIETAEGDVVVHTPSEPLIVNSLTGNYLTGFFYLGYFQDDLEGKAIDEWGCKHPLKVVGFDFIESRAFEQDSDRNFDRKQFSYSSQTYGLNLHVSTVRDYTDQVIRNASLFDNAIGLQVAHDVAKSVMYSTRSNKDQRILGTELDKLGLAYELDGKVPISDVPRTSGLQDKINAELKKVRESFFPAPKSQVVSLC